MRENETSAPGTWRFHSAPPQLSQKICQKFVGYGADLPARRYLKYGGRFSSLSKYGSILTASKFGMTRKELAQIYLLCIFLEVS